MVREACRATCKVLCLVGLLVGSGTAQAPAQQPYTSWRTMGGTSDSANYSSLTQINRSNVNKLQVV